MCASAVENTWHWNCGIFYDVSHSFASWRRASIVNFTNLIGGDVFFSDKQAFLVSKLLKWESNCCLWYISIVDSRYKPLPTREKNVRPRKPRYTLERTTLETENAQSRILGGSCKKCVQAFDLMNCTTHIGQDFTKLLQTNIWVRVVVIIH